MFAGTCQTSGFATEYLRTAGSDQQLEQYQAEMNFLEMNPIRSSWIRETELRLVTKGLNPSIEDYRVRISPTNPWEVKANRSYNKQLVTNTKTRYHISFSKALRSRYELLIDHFFLDSLIHLAEQEVVFKRKYMEQMFKLEKEDMDMEDLISLESGLGNKEIELAELRLEMAEVVDLISLDYDGTLSWDEFALITPERIAELTTVPDSIDQSNIYKLEANQKFLLEQEEFRVEKAQAFSNIGFLQTHYETDRGENIREHLGFQIGVSIPIVNRDKADLIRDEFALIEARNKMERANQAIDQQKEMRKKRLEASLEMYFLIQEKLNRAALFKPTVKSKTDISSVFKHAAYVSELKEKQIKVYKNLLDDFIELLDIQGKLVGEPLRNYLSDSLIYIEG